MRTMTILLHSLLFVAVGSPAAESQVSQPMGDVTVFEGARLITGEDTQPIENATFVVEDGRFTSVGRTGEVPIPEGTSRVDLSGKTVMPAMVELHANLGYWKGTTNAVENFIRENIIAAGAVADPGPVPESVPCLAATGRVCAGRSVVVSTCPHEAAA